MTEHRTANELSTEPEAQEPREPEWRGEIREDSTDHLVLDEIYVQDVYRARPYIHEGATVVDIGANVGVFSVWAAQLGANVVALEPARPNLAQFDRNMVAHRLSYQQVFLLPRGVGARDGWARVMPPDMGPENSGGAWIEYVPRTEDGAVRMVSLDTLFDAIVVAPTVDVLKIDVEGAEFEIIEGAAFDTLRRVAFITIEFHGGQMLHRPAPPGSFGAMVERLAEVFSLEIIGLPSKGGYIYGRRHSD